jgi:hypothetical protein
MQQAHERVALRVRHVGGVLCKTLPRVPPKRFVIPLFTGGSGYTEVVRQFSGSMQFDEGGQQEATCKVTRCAE